MRKIRFRWTAAAVLTATGVARAEDTRNFTSMSIEDLANVEISSVSRRVEPLMQAPAAIYVITNEDIRRTGEASLPEVLRLAPNLQVGRVNALNYAISARGFNSYEASNKLLVLVDGRSVYSLLHSGVFWDAQDLMLEDIEQIEVVRGPGGAVWGANAVNGVINIITRRTQDTQGVLVSAGAGNVDRHVAARYGGAFSESATYRLYVKGFERGHTASVTGADRMDDWDRLQGGFAFDWRADRDTVSVQGDLYDSSIDAVPSEISGGSMTARWVHIFADNSPLEIFAYYDRTRRVAMPLREGADSYNIELQHSLYMAERHSIIWGGGYRVTDDFYTNGTATGLVSPQATFRLGNAFLQDEIALSEALRLTVGLKLEHHTYTGLEYMPNARLAWQVAPDHLLWGAVSRGIRTPSRVDRELTSPGLVAPAPDFRSETLIAYEAGYRTQPTRNAVFSLALFYNVYDNIRTVSLGPGGSLPVMLTNGIEGQSYGAEAWANYQLADWWRVSAGFNLLRKDLRLKPGFTDISLGRALGNDPKHQASLRSYMTPLENLEFDLGLRAVDNLTAPAVPSYVELDARIGFHLTDHIELSLAGINLLDAHHPESDTLAQRGEVRRAFYASVRWTY